MYYFAKDNCYDNKKLVKAVCKKGGLTYCKTIGVIPHTNKEYDKKNPFYRLRMFILINLTDCVDLADNVMIAIRQILTSKDMLRLIEDVENGQSFYLIDFIIKYIETLN